LIRADRLRRNDITTEDNMQRRSRTTAESLDLMPYAWSYGMGAESMAAIHQLVVDPDARPAAIAPDFANLVIVIVQTGDGWSTTGQLVDIGNSGYQNVRSSSSRSM
jgi:hypothetical protein